MEISTITPTPPSAGGGSRIGLADNFDNFLKLLTTQLQNQDPTSPMDADQFTQQLVQFSSVEQQIRSNETLTELAGLMRADQLSQSVSYLGAEVEVDGDVVRLGSDGIAKVRYDLDQQANAVTINISDELGNRVASFQGEADAGRHSLTWDGLGDDGVRRSGGAFKIDIVAETAAGGAVPATTAVTGIVDGVELSGGVTMLSVDGVLIPLERIAAVRTPALAV